MTLSLLLSVAAIGAPPDDAPVISPGPPPVYVSKCAACSAFAALPSPTLGRWVALADSRSALDQRIRNLSVNHQISTWALWLGVAASFATFLAAFETPEVTCRPFPIGCSTPGPNALMLVVSASALLTGGAIFMFTRPMETDFVELLNDWNAAHPDQPFRPSDF